MKSPHACRLMVSILLMPLANRAGQAVKAVDSGAACKATMESLAQKQREATLAAMQASLDKQHASVSTGIAGSILLSV